MSKINDIDEAVYLKHFLWLFDAEVKPNDRADGLNDGRVRIVLAGGPPNGLDYVCEMSEVEDLQRSYDDAWKLGPNIVDEIFNQLPHANPVDVRKLMDIVLPAVRKQVEEVK